MIGSKTYLLRAIIGQEIKGYPSLRELNGKFVEDISKLLEQYATETVKDVIERLNKGEEIFINDKLSISLTYLKKRNRNK